MKETSALNAKQPTFARFKLLMCAIVACFTLQARAQVCSSDLDGSGEVDAGDVGLVLLDFGPCAGCATDMDGSGEVDGGDVGLLLLDFGPCAGPSWATVLEWSADPAVVASEEMRQSISETHLPWRVMDNGTGIEMLLVPPGTFMMGTSPGDAEAFAYEGPSHQVTITQPYYLARKEVTQSKWVTVIGTNPSLGGTNLTDPVEHVSWNDVQPFCAATGMRLPTEAEWEYACRAGNTAARYNLLDLVAWCNSNTSAPKLGGLKLPNAMGFYDMLGNVWEWTADYWDWYSGDSQVDPTGPAAGSYHISRGGTWLSSGQYCRSSMRKVEVADFHCYCTGFRVARNP
ncbi:MAG: formylglycine-generating enzyme family protein [Planctomycetes bacterium]|nr:formylglycine-generating enzyme family protein [Planctomycetota bacterium]